LNLKHKYTLENTICYPLAIPYFLRDHNSCSHSSTNTCTSLHSVYRRHKPQIICPDWSMDPA